MIGIAVISLMLTLDIQVADVTKATTTVYEQTKTEIAETLKYKYMPQYDIEMPVEHQKYIYDKVSEPDSNVTYELFLAMIACESEFDNECVNINTNGSKDVGYCQINSVNWDDFEEDYGLGDLSDPYQNLDAGYIMLNRLMTKYKDENKALIAYNRGEGGMRKVLRTHKSTKYSRKVLQTKAILIENGGI